MENKVVRIDWYDGFEMGDWGVCCAGYWFDLYKYRVGQLIADEDEDLEKIIFDSEKKTVTIKVKHPTYGKKEAIRTVDLNDAPGFFEEVRKDIEVILTEIGTFESVTPNADRTVFEVFSGCRQNADKTVFGISSKEGRADPFLVKDWRVDCCGKTFTVKYGIEALLAARGDEYLERILFDVEKKTVSVKVKNPKLTNPPRRTLDLSDVPDFFEGLRKDIEKILTEEGTFESVTPNADRTVFEVS